MMIPPATYPARPMTILCPLTRDDGVSATMVSTKSATILLIGGSDKSLQQQGPRVILKVIRIMTNMTPIPIAVLSLGIEPTIPMRSMKKPIKAIPVRYRGLRPTRPMTFVSSRGDLRTYDTLLSRWRGCLPIVHPY